MLLYKPAGKIPTKITLNALKGLPHRPCQDVTYYTMLLAVPKNLEWDSGLGLQTLIGVSRFESSAYGEVLGDAAEIGLSLGEVRVEMLWPSKAIKFWSPGKAFRVGKVGTYTQVTLADMRDLVAV